MKKIILLLVVCFGFQYSNAQQMKGSGVYLALNQFLNTSFFHEYLEIRTKAEESVRLFKRMQNSYSEDDVERVIDAYNLSAEYFNAALYNIKDDLLQKDKRKYLIAYPESYSKQVETDLYRAKEFYQNTFQAEIQDVTNGEITGVALLLLLPEAIKYTKLAIDVVK